jgi:hypothetical protein
MILHHFVFRFKSFYQLYAEICPYALVPYPGSMGAAPLPGFQARRLTPAGHAGGGVLPLRCPEYTGGQGSGASPAA